MDENILDTSRLAAVKRTGLLDSAPEEAFDRLTRLATRSLGVPVALVSLVDTDRQFFKSAIGLPEPWATARQTPLSHSFCQHVVTTAEPLIVADAREHPLVRDNLAVPNLGVVAYAGIPLLTPDGQVIGSFCAIDTKPRAWSQLDLDILTDLAGSAAAEIGLKSAKEAAEAGNRAKDRFLAVLSHELRTPASPALMLAAAMADDPALPPAAREDARTIHRNITQQTRLIDDLLDVTRIENGKLSLRVEPVDLHSVLADAVGVCRPDADAKGVRVAMDAGADRPAVSGDPARLRQVFCNLVKNAVKFTPPAGTVTVRSADAADGMVAVTIADTGIGIDPRLLPSIFDAFEQGGRAITDEFSGLGLGLAICKGLVEAHGGTVAASSEGHGKGTTVAVELPVRPPCPLPPAPATAPANAGCPAAGLKILLVEDHVDTLRTMSRLLRRLEHRVTTADSVGAALAAADRDRFDLLISDLGLPDGTGLDLLRELVKRQPIRGIALTGYGMESDIEQTRAAGYSTHLTKPIDFKRLEAAIRAEA